MKKTKLILFTLITFFTVGFAINVNALEVTENITLTEDVNDEIVIPKGKNVTLNLGGKTVTAPNGKVAITNNGTLTIEGEGNVIANGNYAVLNHGAKLTIEGGTYSKADPSKTQSLISNGWYTNSNNASGAYSEMIINGGSFDGGSYTAIKNDSFGKITINDGKFVSDMRDAGIQEAGSSITINGGTFDAVVYLMNWSSVDQEEKVVVINGGTFNKVVNIAATNEENVAKASKVSVSIGDKPTFNSNLYISNSGAAEGTNPIIIDKLAVKTIKGTLTIGTRSADSKMPAVTLDGMTVGGSIILNHLKPSIIKNTTVNGSEIKAFNVTLENVTAKAYTPATKDGTVTIGVGTEIGKVNATANAGNTIIVDGGKVNTILSTGKNKNFGNDSIIINSGSVSSIETSKGNIDINGGKVDSITIVNKYVTTNPITVTLKESADIDKIDNQREGNESATVETNIVLPEGYSIKEDGQVIKAIKYATISGIKSAYTYTGQQISPNVTLKFNNITLQNNTDYKVTYKNNVKAGTATVIITGLGNYSGTVNKTFKITAPKFTNSNLKVTGIVNKVYNKHNQYQKNIVVKYNGKTLKNGTDYTITYKNNKNIGKATVIITGKGNYNGTINKTFNINPVKIAIKKFKKSGNSFRVYYYAPAGGVKYQVAYKQNHNRTWKYVKTSKTNVVARYLKYNMKYYVKVRPYKVVNGQTYYGAWSNTRTITLRR